MLDVDRFPFTDLQEGGGGGGVVRMKGRGFFLWYRSRVSYIFWFVRATEALEPGPFLALCICRRGGEGMAFFFSLPYTGGWHLGRLLLRFVQMCGKRFFGEMWKFVPGIPRRVGFGPLVITLHSPVHSESADHTLLMIGKALSQIQMR